MHINLLEPRIEMHASEMLIGQSLTPNLERQLERHV